MQTKLIQSVAVTAVLTIGAFCQVSTGTPPFGSFAGGPDVINLGNLNVHLSIPVLQRAGRGKPFAYDLSYDSSIWTPVTSNGTTSWQPAANWGWVGTVDLASPATGKITYQTAQPGCGQGKYLLIYSGWTYTDPKGVPHLFPVITQGNSACGNETSMSAYASDGSGYYLSATASAGKVTWRSGALLSGPGALTDSNGNEITVSGSNVYDTLSSATPALVISGTPSSSPVKYTYTNSQGGSSYVSVSYVTHTVQTNFGCSGVPVEYLQSNIPLVDTITLADGSQYSFEYEPTPSHSGNVTGRLKQITLPTGGSILYTYSGGNNGIECSDGSTPGFSRAVTPGRTWTYSRSDVSGKHWQTTVTTPPDPSVGDDTVMDFQEDSASSYSTNNFYEVQRKVYQGSHSSGTLLLTLLNCYNGNYGSCATIAVSTPITAIEAYRTLPSGSSSQTSLIQSNFNTYGLPTTTLAYDFGMTAGTAPSGTTNLLRKTTINYASLAGGMIVDHPSQITVQDGPGNTYSQTSYSYDGSSVATTSGTPQHTTPPYSARGNLTSVAKWVNATTTLYSTFAYYDTGMLNNSTDLSTSSTIPGAMTTYNYTAGVGSGSCGNAFPTSVSEPLSLSRSIVWNCNGAVPTKITDENSQPTNIAYDSTWRTNDVQFPDGGETKITYNLTSSPSNIQVNKLISTGVWLTSQTNLDGLGRTAEQQLTSDPSGTDYVDTTYDALGRAITVSMPYRSGGTVSNATTIYDALYRPTEILTPNGNGTLFSYSGRATLAQQYPSYANKQTAYQVNGLGQLVKVCEVTSNAQQPLTGTGLTVPCSVDISTTPSTGFLTSSQFDPLGNVLQVSNAVNTRQYSYDGLSRMASSTDPELYPDSVTYTYDSQSAGDLYSRTAPPPNQTTVGGTPVVTTYGHDVLHRLTSTSYSDGTTPNVSYVYDQASNWGTSLGNGKGRLTTVLTCLGSVCNSGDVFGYDPLGRINLQLQCTPTTCGHVPYSASYSYDKLGDLLNGTDVQGGLTWTNSFNNAGQMTSVSASWVTGGYIVSGLQYNAAGQPSGDSLGNGITETWSYDAAGNPANYYAGTVYNYNSLAWVGNQYLTAGNDSVNGNWTYTYDNFGRLSTSTCTLTCPNSGNSLGYSYLYDQLGNRWFQNLTAGSGPAPQYSFNSKSEIVGTNYDFAGNMVFDGTHYYTYDAENRIIKVGTSSGSANLATYSYDAGGRRIANWTSVAGSYEFLFDAQGHMVAQVASGSTTLNLAEIYAGGRHWMTYNGGPQFIHADWLGTPRVWTNASGGTVSTCPTLPFGDGGGCVGYVSNTHFTDQQYDGVTNTTQFPARTYAMTQGRFMHVDPSGLAAVDITNPQTWNHYAYVANNPVSYVDPLGLFRLHPGECDASQIDCTGGAGLAGGGGTWLQTYGWVDGGCLLGCDGNQSGQPNSLDWYYWGLNGVVFVPGADPGDVITTSTIGGGGGQQQEATRCAGQALKKNGVALALDTASLGVDAFGPEAQYAKLVAGLTLSTGSMINSAVNQDVAGTGLGVTSYLRTTTEFAATGAGWGWAQWIPFAGAAVDVYSAYHDVSQTISDYKNCMAGQ